MSSFEQRLNEAFDAIIMPPGLKEDTLLKIGERRLELVSAQSQSVQAQNFPTQESPAAQQPQPHNRRRPSRTRRSILALAACFMLVVMGFGGVTAYATQTAIVGIELNPAIELGINRFNIVVDARANNEDGQIVLNDVSLIGKSYDEAFASLASSQAFLSFVEDTSLMDVSIVCADDGQSAQLVQKSEATLAVLPYEGTCNRVSAERHQEAAESGMGVARYEAAQALMNLDSQVSLSDCQSMSMKEMRQRITQLDSSNSYALRGSNASNAHGQGSSGMRNPNNTNAHE